MSFSFVPSERFWPLHRAEVLGRGDFREERWVVAMLGDFPSKKTICSGFPWIAYIRIPPGLGRAADSLAPPTPTLAQESAFRVSVWAHSQCAIHYSRLFSVKKTGSEDQPAHSNMLKIDMLSQ